ncbi:MAG TPA: 50S ribosomal protein L24, partial [Anaeromyxobacteraceae bacterium]|nr:50S ribosomal protein L24 [Anaeromyxobacteraceae bacterium]
MMDVHKNDTVKVIAGREKGRTGKVLEVLHQRGRVRVEKLMMVKRHLKKGRSQGQPQGGIVEKEGTIHLSKVM